MSLNDVGQNAWLLIGDDPPSRGRASKSVATSVATRVTKAIMVLIHVSRLMVLMEQV